MCQENEEKKVKFIAMSFSLMIVTSYYKEFITSFLISPPPPYKIQSLSELLDKQYTLFKTIHPKLYEKNDSKAFTNMLEYYVDKRRREHLTVSIFKETSPNHKFYLMINGKSKREPLAYYAASTNNQHQKRLNGALESALNFTSGTKQIIYCQPIPQYLGHTPAFVQYRNPFGPAQVRITSIFVSNGLIRRWEDLEHKELWRKTSQLQQKLQAKEEQIVVTFVNLRTTLCVYGGLILVCGISLGIEIAWQGRLKNLCISKDHLIVALIHIYFGVFYLKKLYLN